MGPCPRPLRQQEQRQQRHSSSSAAASNVVVLITASPTNTLMEEDHNKDNTTIDDRTISASNNNNSDNNDSYTDDVTQQQQQQLQQRDCEEAEGESPSEKLSATQSSNSNKSSIPSEQCSTEVHHHAITTHAAPTLKPIQYYIPKYLRKYIYPGPDIHGDFCVTTITHSAKLIAQCMVEGFLPMAYNNDILLPKLHAIRSIIPLHDSIASRTQFLHPTRTPNGTTTNSIGSIENHNQINNSHSIHPSIHISKNIRKRSKHYSITINTAFDTVIYHCQQQHGGNGSSSSCWLYPSLLQIFRTIYHSTIHNEHGYSTHIQTSSSSSSTATTTTTTTTSNKEHVSIRLYSIEVWNNETKEFAAGEIGYTVGNTIYTSLTGCSMEDSAGTIQLVTLGTILQSITSQNHHQQQQQPHFAIWDLGMDMPYKRQLGAQLISRPNFVSLFHQLRTMSTTSSATEMLSPTSSSSKQQQPLKESARPETNNNHIFTLLKWPIQQVMEPINCRDILDAANNNNNTNNNNNNSNNFIPPTHEEQNSNGTQPQHHHDPIVHLNKKQRKLLKKQQQQQHKIQQLQPSTITKANV